MLSPPLPLVTPKEMNVQCAEIAAILDHPNTTAEAVRASAKSSVLAPARHHAWRNTISVLAIAKQRIPATLAPEDAQEWRAAVEQAEVFTGLP